MPPAPFGIRCQRDDRAPDVAGRLGQSEVGGGRVVDGVAPARLDNTVLEYFRNLVDTAGGGNYQTLINDALLEHVHRRSTLDVVRQVVREALTPYGTARGFIATLQRRRAARR